MIDMLGLSGPAVGVDFVRACRIVVAVEVVDETESCLLRLEG
jgi:hypothetical protein